MVVAAHNTPAKSAKASPQSAELAAACEPAGRNKNAITIPKNAHAMPNHGMSDKRSEGNFQCKPNATKKERATQTITDQ